MSGRIPQPFIDDLLERADIVEIIDSRLSLRKTGRNYSALCPFHKEKTPSFSVNPDKQFYYCFGCGAGGNALGFLMDYERLDFPIAVESLAHHVGLEVPREQAQNPQQFQQRRDIYTLLEKSADFYQQQLREHSSAQKAVNYLKARGLSGAIAKQFGVGYAPPGWDNLHKQLAKTDEDTKLLSEGGMLIEKEQGGCYDRFRDRIIFPIRDSRGRVVAFGGRVFGDEKPKYLNSPETPVFHKNRELYGLYEARQANRHLSKILVVEGYMDVVALAQHGISYATATLGTATSEAHLEKIFRLVDEVIFCFDGDQAGRKAADRALENTLTQMRDGRQVRFLFLPDGEDPDSLVRAQGQKHFQQLIDTALPLSEFLFQSVSSNIDLQTMDGRARLSTLSLPLIHKLPDGVFKSLMLQALADRAGISQQALEQLIAKEQAAQQHSKHPLTQPQHQSDSEVEQQNAHYSEQIPDDEPGENLDKTASPISRQALTEPQKLLELSGTQKAIMLLLHYPLLSTQIDRTIIYAALGEGGDTEASGKYPTDPDINILAQLLEKLAEDPHATPHLLLGHWLHQPAGELFTRLLSKDPAINEQAAAAELKDCINHLTKLTKRQNHQQLINELSNNKNLRFDELSETQKQELKRIYSETKG